MAKADRIINLHFLIPEGNHQAPYLSVKASIYTLGLSTQEFKEETSTKVSIATSSSDEVDHKCIRIRRYCSDRLLFRPMNNGRNLAA